jgi:hypothetical protein
MTEPWFEDMPPDLRWLLIIEPFGSVEARMLRHYRIEPTPERVTSRVSVLKEVLAEKGEYLPTERHLAMLREYRTNGSRWR